MIDRYKLAQAKGKAHYERAVEEDQNLLTGFGLGLLSVSNGIRVVLKESLRESRINPWDVIEINAKLWGWLRPLLIELAELRAAKKATANGVNGVNGAIGANGYGGSSGKAPNGVPRARAAEEQGLIQLV